MEDLIYIVLIIVWLLVSFLRRKPKTQKTPQKQTESATGSEPVLAEEEVNMEDMLEEFFGTKKKKKEEPVKPDPVFESAEKRHHADYNDGRQHPVRRKEEPMKPAYEQYSGKTVVSDDFEFASDGKVQTIDELIKAHKAKEAAELALAEEKYGTVDSDIPEFDLRTAVIFSEILNKKY